MVINTRTRFLRTRYSISVSFISIIHIMSFLSTLIRTFRSFINQVFFFLFFFSYSTLFTFILSFNPFIQSYFYSHWFLPKSFIFIIVQTCLHDLLTNVKHLIERQYQILHDTFNVFGNFLRDSNVRFLIGKIYLSIILLFYATVNNKIKLSY